MKHRTYKWLIATIVIVFVTIGMVGIAVAQTPEPPKSTPLSNEKIESGLATKLAAGSADYIIRFKEQADLNPAYQMSWNERGEFVYNTLRQTAEKSQSDAKAVLGGSNLRYQTFIAGNELYVWGGNLDSAQTLAALPEVEYIRDTRIYHIDPVAQGDTSLKIEELTWVGDLLNSSYGPAQAVQAQAAPQAIVDWGIADTNADDFWGTFGVQGNGIVVANIDTGVQWDHPALINQFKCAGNPSDPSCWADPSNVCGGSACDNNGHGTHTMGTMVGDDDPALLYTVGMAPDSKWIACKGCESGSCSDLALNSCADWILAPGGSSANRPNVVNNSWGGNGGDKWYQTKVQVWRAAGIFPAFSAGNSYSCSSLGSPGDYQESFATASHREWDRLISDFSSKGPSSTFGHEPYTKPNISAPGEEICSTVPGDGWNCSYSGTSMASPHTAGAVALLWSCNPGLIGQIDQTFEILQNTTDPAPDGSCGAPDDGEGNNTYGYGYLNIYSAGLLWCGDIGSLEGTVTDATTGDPIALANVYSTPGPYATTTGPDGQYDMTMQTGSYDVTVEAFGYYSDTVTVDIIKDGTTVQDVALVAVSSSLVSGNVTDSGTGWPLYAWVGIAGYPGGGVWTDPVTGYYEVSLPTGSSFDFSVSAWVPGYLDEARTVLVDGNRTEDFALVADLEACVAPGYQLEQVYSQDFEAGNGGFAPSGTNSTWEWGVPTTGPGSAHSGVNVWATNRDGNYNNSENSYLTSPNINLSAFAGSEVRLGWWDWQETETCCDYTAVQVSNNGGGTWTQVYGPEYEGIQSWTEHEINLDASYAVTNFRMRFYFHSDSSITYPGWYVDDVEVAADCQPQAGGLVVGNVYDSNLGMPLTGAEVSNDAGYSTTTLITDDPAVDDSFYTLFSPAGERDFTASYTGFNMVTESVDVQLGDTVLHDFYLPAGYLVVDPASLHATVPMGASDAMQMTLSNIGDGDVAFEIRERDRGMIPTVRLPQSDGNFPRSADLPSIGRAERATSTEDQAESLDIIRLLTGAPAYAVDVTPGYNLVYFESETPGSWNVIAPLPGNQYFGGDFLNGDFTRLYVVDFGTNELHTVDTTTGGVTVIGPSAPTGGEAWTGLTGAPDGTLYASGSTCSSSTLYAIDPETAAVTTVGSVTNAPCLIAIAANADGDLYGVDIVNDTLVQIDPVTGAGTVVGSIGFDANYAQGMDFEELSGVLYLAAYNGSSGQGELRIADTTTGNTSLVGAFPGGAEVDSLGFATGGTGVDVPWLSEAPITGTITAGSTQSIEVTFDAGMVSQPGDYLADLKVKNDTPYGDLTVPVTMTVIALDTYGKLEGTVTGLGYCDANPEPAVEAEVLITSSGGMTWTVMTDNTGYYSLWFDEAGSPFTVAVTYPEHKDGLATGVVVTGDETTTVDFDLRWLEPCVSVDPGSYDFEIGEGYTINTVLELTNDGAQGTPFAITERDMGMAPPMKVNGVGEWLYRAETGVEMVNNRGETDLAFPKAYRWTSARPSAMNVLIYADDYYHTAPNTFLDQALQELGMSYTAHYDADWTGFVNDLQAGGWDLVLVGNDNWSDSSWFAPLDSYIQGGGLAVVNSWTVDGVNPLWTTLGITWIANDYDPPDPVYWWEPGHPIFTDPEEVPEFTQLVGFRYLTYGQQVEPLADFQALAGYTTPGPDPNLAAMVLGNDNRTVFKGFLDGQNDADLDTDGMLDGVELWINLISGIETGFGVDVPWVSEDPISGTLEADGVAPIDVTFDSMTYTVGTQLMAMLKVRTDDPFEKTIGIPITMTIAAEAYGADVGADQALNGRPTESVTYQVVVRNASNGPVDSFDIVLSGSDWASTTTTEVGPLDVWESETIEVVVEIPADAVPGDTDEVVVTATSQGDDAVSDSATLTTTVIGEYALEMDPAENAQEAPAGETVTYYITCLNVADPNDIVLSLSAHNWDVQLSMDSFSLGTGEDAVVTVTVTIPADAGGESETVTVTATGLGGSTAATVLTTTAESGMIYLPLVMDGHTR